MDNFLINKKADPTADCEPKSKEKSSKKKKEVAEKFCSLYVEAESDGKLYLISYNISSMYQKSKI